MDLAEGLDAGGPSPADDAPEDALPEVAPPVVAVVVTSDPGPWLEEVLASLGAQDYPNFSVLVIDGASEPDPTSRVAAVLPTAYVRRLPTRTGFGAAANQVLEVVEGASHFLICHDDVAPDPDAVSQLVEEAFRSNAGVVGPKLVDWQAPERLLEVGMAVDKAGVPSPLVERGELDQEQHDAVRDVFYVSGACTLVRADLFAALGGFDAEMTLFGEDLDLCWRAQVVGARVVVAPAARVRHLEALSQGLRGGPTGDEARRDEQRELQLRHRLRAVLKNYGFVHLVRVLPQVITIGVAETLYTFVSGRRATARATVSSWRWNLKRLSQLRAARSSLRAQRLLPDSEVRRLEVRGSARLTSFIRGQLASEDRSRRWSATGGLAANVRQHRQPIAVWSACVLVLLVGTRQLITGHLPAVGQLAPFPGSPFTFLGHFGRDWRTTGLGAHAQPPAAFGLLGLVGVVFLGAMGTLQKLLVLGALPLGAVGAYRLARPFGSSRARLVALVVYLAVPLPYDALSRGRWAGLIAYAVLPWVVGHLARAGGMAPYDTAGETRSTGTLALRLGALLAVVGALAPSVLPLVVVVALALVAGSALAGVLEGAVRALVVSIIGVAIAAALLFPWTLELVLPGSGWAGVTGVDLPSSRGLGLGAIIRMQTGFLGHSPLGWAFLVAAVLPLLVGRGWRLAWAVRLWTVAVACWLLLWVGGRGWLPVPLPAPEVMLAPAAVALALSIALGLVAFEVDLPGYRFGWRQAASTLSAAAVVVGLVPVLGGAVGGRWHTPSSDMNALLSWMPAERAHGDFRVLWLGDPEALPLDGWRLSQGLAYATSNNGPPDATDLWPGAGQGATQLIADSVTEARSDDTQRLGHLLAPMAIRYIVVPVRAAPGASKALPPPADVLSSLDQQADLRLLEADNSLHVYENAAWAPARFLLSASGSRATTAGGLAAADSVDLSGSTPLLGTAKSPVHFKGRVPRGAVYLSQAADPGWRLVVNGHPAARRRAFGWANAFAVTSAGNGDLQYRTTPARYLAILFELVLWAVALRWLWRTRSRWRRSPERPAVDGPGRGAPVPADDDLVVAE